MKLLYVITIILSLVILCPLGYELVYQFVYSGYGEGFRDFWRKFFGDKSNFFGFISGLTTFIGILATFLIYELTKKDKENELVNNLKAGLVEEFAINLKRIFCGEIEEEIHDLVYREAIRNIGSLKNHTEFKKLIKIYSLQRSYEKMVSKHRTDHIFITEKQAFLRLRVYKTLAHADGLAFSTEKKDIKNIINSPRNTKDKVSELTALSRKYAKRYSRFIKSNPDFLTQFVDGIFDSKTKI